MGHLRGSLLAALLCMVHLAIAGDNDAFDSELRCVTPPTWTSGGVNPMLQGRGNVTVVALLQASSPSCLSQASKLEELRLELVEEGLDDVNFMVVNSGDWWSRFMSSYLHSRVSFPVYEEGYAKIWETLNGAKDDMLVYDRCGYLTYHLRMPYSSLDWPHVDKAIRKTHNGTDPCNCGLPVAVRHINSENMEALATNSPSGVERDVPSTGVKEETNKAKNPKNWKNTLKKRHKHLRKHHHDGSFLLNKDAPCPGDPT